MSKTKARPNLIIVAHHRLINGELIQIDPLKTDIPDRCKLIWTEIMTDCKCELKPRIKSDS